MGEQHPKVIFPLLCILHVAVVLTYQCHHCFLLGSSKRRRSSLSGGHSSNDEGNDSPSGLQSDGHSPSLRKQPKRVVKPRVYFDLVDYDSDLDDKALSSSASPARRRGVGPRFSQGKLILSDCLTQSSCFFCFLRIASNCVVI